MAQASKWLWGSCFVLSACAQSGGAGPEPVSTRDVQANVMLLTDSSGSMVWRPSCACETAGCTECLADCSRFERNSWHAVLGAIGGSFGNFSCEARERTSANGATYDIDYPKPFYTLGANVTQSADGVLDRYASRVNFGLATFDAMRTYVGSSDLVSDFDAALSSGADGQFSYAGGSPASPRSRPDGSRVGKLFYPGADVDYFIDTGIMSADAPSGGLIMPGDLTSGRIRAALKDLRPFGGTPTASALDDLYYAYDEARVGGKNYVVLITDGLPDDDFRAYPAPGCDCAANGTCPAGSDPSQMNCPYPTAESAAKHLRCGFDEDHCDGPVRQLLIVGLGMRDQHARAGLDAIAAVGGGRTFYADNEAELKTALDAALEHALADAGN